MTRCDKIWFEWQLRPTRLDDMNLRQKVLQNWKRPTNKRSRETFRALAEKKFFSPFPREKVSELCESQINHKVKSFTTSLGESEREREAATKERRRRKIIKRSKRDKNLRSSYIQLNVRKSLLNIGTRWAPSARFCEAFDKKIKDQRDLNRAGRRNRPRLSDSSQSWIHRK